MYISNCLLNAHVYINRLVLFSALATETSLQWAFDAETHRWSSCWEEVIVECPVLHGTLTLPILSRHGNIMEDEGRKSVWAGGGEECYEMLSSGHHSTAAFMNTQQLCLLAQDQARQHSAWRGEMLLRVYLWHRSCWNKESHFSLAVGLL